MGNKTIFSSTAAKDIESSYHWYENRRKGLGDQFINLIDLTIQLMLSNPEGFPNKYKQYREATLKKFPYQIIYEYLKESQTIYVFRVFHTKRHPKIKYKR
jgi:plasmid stabilization system protein ParE